jgi:cobaltochelatase CobS
LQKEDRKIFIVETNKLVAMHPENVICATSNTNGQGDDTGLYSQGTRVQSYAQLNRFLITVRLNYLKPEEEKKMLAAYYPELDNDEIESLVMAVNKVRDGFSNGAISVPLSTRDLINWSDKYVKFGDAMKGARYCFLNRMSQEDSKVCEGIIQRSFEDIEVKIRYGYKTVSESFKVSEVVDHCTLQLGDDPTIDAEELIQDA